jgi:hypothetical protein
MVVSLRWLPIFGVVLFIILHRVGGLSCLISTRLVITMGRFIRLEGQICPYVELGIKLGKIRQIEEILRIV